MNRETGEVVESFAIITVEPSPDVVAIHDRMPLILEPEDLEEWLAPEPLPNPHLFLQPYREPLDVAEVDIAVKNVAKMSGPECLDPSPPLTVEEQRAMDTCWSYGYQIEAGKSGPVRVWKNESGRPSDVGAFGDEFVG